jgi:cytochrome c-type biogenesis protein
VADSAPQDPTSRALRAARDWRGRAPGGYCAVMLELIAAVDLGAALREQPLLALGALFVAGLVTSLTPCIYPMIPITAGVIAGAGTTTRSRRRVLALTLSYVLGLALLYASLGLIAGLTGSLFGAVSAHPWARLATGNLLLVFGLAMLDVFPVRLPAAVHAWAAGRGAGSVPAVFVLGAASGVVAAPCGAPAFAAVLTFVGATGSAVLGFAYLFVFSLGMTALLIAVGVSAGTLAALPRAGAWTLWIKRVGGVILLLVAQYYFVQAGMVW